MNAKIGINEFDNGCDVQIVVGDLYLEFETKNLDEANQIISALKNAKVAINPENEFWNNN